MFKINLSTKEGKTFKLESEAESLVGKELRDKISGKEILPDLQGWEFEITGASDKAGFTAHEDAEGTSLSKLLLEYGKGFKKRPRREGKRVRPKNRPKGLRLRKTVRGKVISPEISQVNLKVVKEGSKKLSDIFPDQAKTESPSSPAENVERNKSPEPEPKSEEAKTEQKPAEQPKEEQKEKSKEESVK